MFILSSLSNDVLPAQKCVLILGKNDRRIFFLIVLPFQKLTPAKTSPFFVSYKSPMCKILLNTMVSNISRLSDLYSLLCHRVPRFILSELVVCETSDIQRCFLETCFQNRFFPNLFTLIVVRTVYST